MNGLELSRGYFEDYGLPMLKKEFPELLPFLAAGFTGRGSEHFGFDDEVSRDHDFEPGFLLLLPGESVIDRRTEFLLSRAYAKLPKEYGGVSRLPVAPVGGSRNGVKRTGEYYLEMVGEPSGVLTREAWLHLQDYALAEAVNGEIFFDPYGEVTGIRERLSNMPRDYKLKRIAGNLLLMGQSGQYNYKRCLLHHEKEAAQLAVHEFVCACMKVVFLLNGHYMPFYKWSFRALRGLGGEAAELADKLGQLLTGTGVIIDREALIEEIAADVVNLLKKSGVETAPGYELEQQAYAVNEQISDAAVRGMHILTAV